MALAIHPPESAAGICCSSSWAHSPLPPRPTPPGYPGAPALGALLQASNMRRPSASHTALHELHAALRPPHPGLLCCLISILLNCLRVRKIPLAASATVRSRRRRSPCRVSAMRSRSPCRVSTMAKSYCSSPLDPATLICANITELLRGSQKTKLLL